MADAQETDWANRIEVVCGETTPAAARVFARLPGVPVGETWRLSGTVTGPFCAWSQTLPATIKLRPVLDISKADGTVVAEAVIPDPCFWTPELPMTYRARVELRRDSMLVGAVERTIGLRSFAARGKSFYLAGRRCVLRGAVRDAVFDADLANWRQCGAAMLTAGADEELCRESTRLGVPLLAHVHAPLELPRLAKWPCVLLAVLDRNDAARDRNVTTLYGLPLAISLVAGDDEPLPSWAAAAIVPCDDAAAFARAVARCNVPVIVTYRANFEVSIADARRACDQLQGDVAPHGDFAGYIVGSVLASR